MVDTKTMAAPVVNLFASWAFLLSGSGVGQCVSYNDTSCRAGIAAVSSYARNLTEPTLVLQRADLTHPFVQMLGWEVNRKVIHDRLGWSVFASSANLVNNQRLYKEKDFQTRDMPLLITNLVVPSSNSWQPFVQPIHFDDETHLAVLSILPDSQDRTEPQFASAKGALDYIYRLNEELEGTNPNFWIPVIYYSDPRRQNWLAFLDKVLQHEHPPSLLLEIENQDSDRYPIPQLLNDTTWVISYRQHTRRIHRFEITKVGQKVTGVKLHFIDLTEIPEDLKDDQFASDIEFLHGLASEAVKNDPVIGYSEFMPLARDDGETRKCMAGECPIGNLFADALKWYTETDFAFIASGGIRGPGWEAGAVRVTDLWGALPFANQICTGTMSGVSLFKLLNYSTSVATFTSTYTETGDNLLQVSGVRYTYNTELDVSRLVDIEMFDHKKNNFVPVERLKLYRFATDGFMCDFNNPFPSLTGDFQIEGEISGQTRSDDLIHQFIVAQYLTETTNATSPYQTSIQGRLNNDTLANETINFVQTEEHCELDTVWDELFQTCVACTNAAMSNVKFSDSRLDFMQQSGWTKLQEGRVLLVNRELFSITATLNVVPSWLRIANLEDNQLIFLESGESIGLDLLIGSPDLQPGLAVGGVSFGIFTEDSQKGCGGVDASFEISLETFPKEDKNYLGKIRYAGLGLMGVALLCCTGSLLLVFLNRRATIVKTLQPPFLYQLCAGVFVMVSSITPLSLDDEIVSETGLDIACMSFPWLCSMGFTIAFSALFSKLWRINKLFNATNNLRRKTVKATDVLLPFAVLFALNLAALLVWTFVDPLVWERSNTGEPFNTFGHCEGNGPVSTSMMSVSITVNMGALVLACCQAYTARNISDEFSEAKYLGIAIFSWLQVLAVGGPVLFLIDAEDVTTRYFLVTVIIFLVCMSVLGLIFMPIALHLKPKKAKSVKISGFSSSRASAAEAIESHARGSIVGGGVVSSIGFPGDENLIIKNHQMATQLATLNATLGELEQQNKALITRNEELENIVMVSSSDGLTFDERAPVNVSKSDFDFDASADMLMAESEQSNSLMNLVTGSKRKMSLEDFVEESKRKISTRIPKQTDTDILESESARRGSVGLHSSTGGMPFC